LYNKLIIKEELVH